MNLPLVLVFLVEDDSEAQSDFQIQPSDCMEALQTLFSSLKKENKKVNI